MSTHLPTRAGNTLCHVCVARCTSSLFEVSPNDSEVYQNELKDYLPARIIDFHTHVWLDALLQSEPNHSEVQRTVTWPSLVAKDNPVCDLRETYKLLFPGKHVTPVMFSGVANRESLAETNRYVQKCSEQFGYPALYYSHPKESAEDLEQRILMGGFLGIKSYLDLASAYLPADEIRILDFFPPHQLEVIDRLGLVVMLHIPRPMRLKDPVNLAQILEIKQKHPNIQLIIAHIGRAYSDSDVGNAFSQLKESSSLLFDFSANTNENVMQMLLENVEPCRVLFGSDLPITRMRMRRIVQNGKYINLIPPGVYGDTTKDPHLREVTSDEAKQLTFFLYEQILAFKRAAQHVGLTKENTEDVFFGNAERILKLARKGHNSFRGTPIEKEDC